MRIGSARLTAGLQPYWGCKYDEIFYDGWHHFLTIGIVWIYWHSWNRIFWRWRDRSVDPACDT